jgi:hypothetical protein
MRPRGIQSVPGLDPAANPFDRFKQFARMLATVFKNEADKEMNRDSTKIRGVKKRA